MMCSSPGIGPRRYLGRGSGGCLRASLLSLLLGAYQMAAAADAATPEIWFGMRGWSTDWHGVNARQGWEKLFLDANAPWPGWMDHVKVVAINTRVPDDVLRRAVATLKQHHIAIAIESLGQSWVDQPKCGRGVEGYTSPAESADVARKIKAVGGNVAYVTMDGPLFGGHFAVGPNACHSSIANVSERAAALMREYTKAFPNVIIGDTEPFPSMAKQSGWQDAYREWMRTFQEAVGRPVSFLTMDINWPEDNGRWQQAVEGAARFARANHLQVGIIYNAAFPEGAKSDEQWLSGAESNFTQIEQRMGIVPDKALFESWAWFPKRTITDQSGLGEDDLVKRYLVKHGIVLGTR